jgi:hypothetical protein
MARWSKDMDDHLLRLSAAADADPAITYSVMAARINEAFGANISRNAIAGRLKRLKAGAEPKPSTSCAVADASKPRPPKPPASASASVKPQCQPVGLLALKASQCRWPVNDDSPFLFCAAPKSPHHASYCAHHHTLSERRVIRNRWMSAP